VELAQRDTEMVTCCDCPGGSTSLDGLTESVLLDADHSKATLPSLVNTTTHVQRTAPAILVLVEQFLGMLKLVGLTDNFGGVGFGVGVGVGLGGCGVGVGVTTCCGGVCVGAGVGVGVGKAVTTRVIATCTFSLPVLIPNVAE
jgi:hypothetical protein